MYQTQGYNYFSQQPLNQYNMRQPQMMQQSILKGRMVSSLDEAKASPIDFDGSIFYFPDLANKRIYTKQINLDGTATLNMYELKPIIEQQMPTGDYVTRKEFEEVISKLMAQQQQPVDEKKQTAQIANF